MSVFLFIAVFMGALLCPTIAVGAEAEIVLLQGKGEKSAESRPQGWTPANPGDRISGGFWVRTLQDSQMGLAIPDRNQIRLNQNSTLQVKTQAETTAFKQARVKLLKGRAWSQARPRVNAGQQNAGPSLVMETPAAQLAIRGTDWEVEVAEDGRTHVVVVSGRVDLGNEKGSVSLGAGEAGRAEQGVAPVKLTLVNPADRVQWVSAWVPRGRRWLGWEAARYPSELALISSGEFDRARERLLQRSTEEPGGAVLLADLLVYSGEMADAERVLAPHARDGAGDERATALLTRVLLRLDRVSEARRMLETGLSIHRDSSELQLAAGELATLVGNAAAARDAFTSVAAREPHQQVERAQVAEAWFGLGRISSEQQFLRAARRELRHSLAIDPTLDNAAAELATVDSFAGKLGAAQLRYDELLARDSANYPALTGRGINSIKQGQPDSALDDFLRASLIEPRYARGWLYQGVAFYQSGDVKRAEEAFGRARSLDPTDPIPWMLTSQVAADALDYGTAVKAARAAQTRMPFLKSLNQLQNDQKGSANIGASLASAGLEEWARYYGDAAFSPFWAGSQLFLADRFTGLFSRNSALMTGFLADPLVFGASNRHSALIQKPGHYRRIDLDYQRDDYEERQFDASANGAFAAPIPAAYFARAEVDRAEARRNQTLGDNRALTLGLGAKPREDTGIFAFLVDNEIRSDLHEKGLPDADLHQQDSIADVGVAFEWNPHNQFWLKAGNREQDNTVDGLLVNPALAQALEAQLPGFEINRRGRLDANDTGISADDLQFRHSMDIGKSTLSWGLESSEQEQTLVGRTTFEPIAFTNEEHFLARDHSAWMGLRVPLTESLRVEAALHAQDIDTEQRDLRNLVLLPLSLVLPVYAKETRESGSELNIRAGIAWQPRPRQLFRLVTQQWNRPASFGSLSPPDTLGIVLGDRITAPGGSYERVRLQYDGESGERLFLQFFADHERVDNGLAGKRTALFSYQIEQLSQLRQIQEFFTPLDDWEESPVFSSGSVKSLGAAINYLASDSVSLSARWLWRDSDNDDTGAGGRDWVPYVPHGQAVLRAQWRTPWRLLLAANATWRDERLENPESLLSAAKVIDSGWDFGLRAYWESTDKRHSLQALAEQLAPDDDAMALNRRDPLLRLQYGYRF